MSAEQFQALCDTFCEMNGAPQRTLQSSDDGTLGFYLTLGAYRASFYLVPPASTSDGFMILDAGALPEPTGVKDLAMLLRINTLMYGPRSPVIGLTEQGHLQVHLAFSVESTSAQALWAAANGLSNWADQWHAGKWMDDRPPLPPQMGTPIA